jgi:hypothetical protein
VQRPDHAHGDLAPVRYEDAAEHEWSLRKRRLESRTAVGENGIAVRDEDAFDRQVEQRPERAPQVVERRVAEPCGGAVASTPRLERR